jgi:16S rRNA (guanine527-N7)-methyltransferase
LELALEVGSLGGESLVTQIAHAWDFAACAETFLALDLGLEPKRDMTSSARADLAADGPARFLDLGSGGGLPGLVLAHRWRRSEAVLLDGNFRKAVALRKAVDACGWANRVKVVHARAEVAARSDLRNAFDLVVARSFGPPPVTAECAAPFLLKGGLLVVSEPPVDIARDSNVGACASNAVRWPPEGLAVVGLRGIAGWRRRFGYQVLQQVLPCPERFPRRVGVAMKRPIYKVPSSGASHDGRAVAL